MSPLAISARRLNSKADWHTAGGLTFGPRGDRKSLPSLLLVTDQDRLPDPLAAAGRLPPGSGIILRHYSDPERRRLATALSRLCRARGLCLLVAEDGRLAAQVGAHGLHFPEHAVAAASPWRRQRPDWLITVAAHSAPALRRAANAGAHAALLSPVFLTASHPGAKALGPLGFARLVHGSPLPVYGLGGINAPNVAQLKRSGAVGIAGISGIVDVN